MLPPDEMGACCAAANESGYGLRRPKGMMPSGLPSCCRRMKMGRGEAAKESGDGLRQAEGLSPWTLTRGYVCAENRDPCSDKRDSDGFRSTKGGTTDTN